MSSIPGKERYQGGMPWYAAISEVESALFACVQIVMASCVALVVAQALAA